MDSKVDASFGGQLRVRCGMLWEDRLRGRRCHISGGAYTPGPLHPSLFRGVVNGATTLVQRCRWKNWVDKRAVKNQPRFEVDEVNVFGYE